MSGQVAQLRRVAVDRGDRMAALEKEARMATASGREIEDRCSRLDQGREARDPG